MSLIILRLSFVALSSFTFAQDFGAACTNSTLDGTTLNAMCETDSGANITASINLNNCVASYNGTLTCSQTGNYSTTCSACEYGIGPLQMVCMCYDGNATYPDVSVINLDTCINNQNGTLTC
ncbi:Cyanovirin-N [Hygrophoropsis aurantiaca]|uniref:Cyanovirin-N n=1 Tax=Hygrophoropsis aurantiaca TaxID=72124 RepID=A0ACB8A5S3_9AGAM|nr:Cyanovirin-N [Hygrophoropsis aurantiaca]